MIECQVVEAGSQLSVALEDESQQPWEHSPTHPHPTHVLSTNATQCLACCDTTCNYSSYIGCKLQDLAVHMTGVAALGSQLMPLTVESVYKNVYFGISLDQRTCEWHIHVLQPTLCMLCVCMRVLCVLSARVLCMCGYLTLRFNEAAAIHSPWTDVADSQGRIPRADCYSHTNYAGQSTSRKTLLQRVGS